MSAAGLVKPTPPEHHKRTRPKALFVIVVLCAVGILGLIARNSPTMEARTTSIAAGFVDAFAQEPATAAALVCNDAPLPSDRDALVAALKAQLDSTQLNGFTQTSYESPDSTGVAFVYGTINVASRPTSVVFGVQHSGRESCVFSLHNVVQPDGPS
jgi:hypothetical protein